MSKRNKGQLDRRQLLRASMKYGLGGAVALEQLGGVPMFGQWISDTIINPALPHLDAFRNIQSVLAGGAAALKVHEAMAAGEDEWTIVQIKVVNHVYAPLVFKLGELANGSVTTGNGVPMASSRGGATEASLVAAGVDEISDMPRYQNLRFNKWFANMLHNGTSDGLAAGAQNMRGLEAGDVEPLSSDKVAIQGFLGLDQIANNNHSLKGCKLREALPDITLFAADSGLVNSPLGITCLMMGGEYDKAEGAIGTNAVLGASDTSEVAVVGSRSVRAYVQQIQQYVGTSYSDRRSIEQNVVYRLDKLVVQEPALRREMINSISQFRNGLGTFQSAGDLELETTAYDPAQGNRQSTRATTQGSAATSEFLAQCKYVTKALEMQGQPLRNFSLMLNMVDLDGSPLDAALVNVGGNAEIRAFTYVEGMRQLAMGLNILGKAIAAGRKMVVVVSSEGGRGAGGEDQTTSFSLVMGPGGGDYLADKLYANMNQLDSQTGPYIANHAAPGNAMAWDMEGLRKKDGSAADDGTKPTTGDVQMGVVEFLEEMTGKNARKDLSDDDGRFVKLERSS